MSISQTAERITGKSPGKLNLQGIIALNQTPPSLEADMTS